MIPCLGNLPAPMASDVYEDSITLRIGLLEALPVVAGQSYPLPPLRPTGQVEERDFACVVLENPYLRLTVLPALGGRILRAFDKRTGLEALASREPLTPLKTENARGASLPDGIQWMLSGEERLNALGPVAYQVDASMDEGDDAAVWLAECASAPGLSWHLRVSLPPDAALIHLQARILNRTRHALPYEAGLTLPTGWALSSPRAELTGLGRRPRGVLGPRQVDTWSATLAPFTGLATTASSTSAAVDVGHSLKFQASRQSLGCKAVILTSDGQTLEAPLDLYPEQLLELPLGSVAPVALVLKDAQGKEMIRWGAEGLAGTDEVDGDSMNAGTRHIFYLSHGIRALKERRYADADTDFEQALLYNGDDPLLWWIKGVTRRLMGDLSEDRPELPNAHYLAPLEPALRAEAFLSQPSEQSRDPNPLVAAMSPDEIVEMACLLLEHGLPDEATRWIDESLRHYDLAMLRYLQADALLTETRMATEAAQHLMLAASAQVPPYPWRPYEVEAVARLLKRFPADMRLREFANLTMGENALG